MAFFLRALQSAGDRCRRLATELAGRCSGAIRSLRQFAGEHRRLRQAVAFGLACLLTLGLESWLEHEIEVNEQHNIVTQPVFGIATLYHWRVTAGPRKPEPRSAFLIEISRGTAPGVNVTNRCKERQYIGDLLKTLALAHPKVVVIDKFFDNAPCEVKVAAFPKATIDTETANLVAGAAKLCEDKATVVVGRALDDKALKSGSPIPFPLEEAYDFRKAGAFCVKEAVVNLDPDFRRVSLRFPDVQPVRPQSGCKRPCTEADSPYPPSLPLAAALAYRPNLEIAGWPDTAPPPYVSFLEPRQFSSVKLNASDVLCGTWANWRACGAEEIRPNVRALALGKVVIIGDNFPEVDQHPTVVGTVAGYELQANYIESLIDNRLFLPVPELLDWVAGAVIFVWFEYLFWRYRGFQALIRVAVLFAGVALAVYLVATNAGYYFNPMTISILAILNSRVFELVLRKESSDPPIRDGGCPESG